MRATVRCPGTCGELVQGTLNDTHFLITCPVNLYSEVTVELTPGNSRISGLSNRPKTEMAVRQTLDCLGLPEYGAEVIVASNLPEGKGMASSTADIAAACLAAARAAGKDVNPDRVGDIALSVEPSDGVMHPGIWMFDHVTGSIRSKVGNALPLTIIALDLGGKVDTVAFNARTDLPAKNRAKEGQIWAAVEMVRRGIEQRDPSLVGQGATISARANQDTLHKPELEEVLAYATGFGAVGVNVAHSGTLIGVIFPEGHNGQVLAERMARRFPKLERVYTLELVDGGLEVVSREEHRHGGISACL